MPRLSFSPVKQNKTNNFAKKSITKNLAFVLLTFGFIATLAIQLMPTNLVQAEQNSSPVYTPAANYLSQFGGSSQAQYLSAPHGLTIDSNGNIYVSDNGNNRIVKFNSSGTYQLKFGTYGSGNGQFDHPDDLITDSTGNVYVVDTNNNRIQKFSPNGTYLSQFGTEGTGNGQLEGPTGIATDSNGNIYVSDQQNNRVEKFNSSGVYQSQFGTYGTGDGQLNGPDDIYIDSTGNIYVADKGNNRIQKFNSSGVYQSQFGTTGVGDGQFNQPAGISVDSNGNTYVTDQGNNRVQKFSSNGTYISQFGTTGSDDGEFNLLDNTPQVVGIATDSTGNIYIADSYNNRIQKFNSTGTYQSQINTLDSTNGFFDTPTGIATDSNGNIYISDQYNNRIQKFSSNGTYQSQFGTESSTCEAGDAPVIPDDNGKLCYPDDIYIDSSNNIYVADKGNNRIQKFSSSGVYQSQFGSYGSGNGEFDQPAGIATDSIGNIYVADTGNNRIQKFSSSGVYQSQFGSYGSGNGEFDFIGAFVVGISIDQQGNIYVVDTYNNRIQKFTSNGTYLSQFGTGGSGDGQLSNPTGITIDPSGNIYVTDRYNNRIQKFTSNGTYLSQFGTESSTCEAGGDPVSPGDNGKFCYPDDLTTDSTGNIYVVDQRNNRIQKFARPATTATLPTAPPTTPGTPNSITLEVPTDTNITSSSTVSSASLTTQDPNYTYPLGLVNFNLSAPIGSTQTITLTFTTDLKPSDVIARKYNPTTRTYANVPNATISQTTQDGKPALQLTYQITDGGALDLDGVANGTIIDPVGLAVLTNSSMGSNLADTGMNIMAIQGMATVAIVAGFGVVVYRKRHDSSTSF